MPDDDKSFDFALQLAKTKTTFDYRNRPSAPSTLRQIGFSYYERFTSAVELGFYGGHTMLDQTGNPATTGIEPDGNYAGIGLRVAFLETSFSQLFLHLTYEHEQLKHDRDGQSVALNWDEPRLQIGAVSTSLQGLRVYGGAIWGAIDGQERTSGISAHTTTAFNRHDRLGGFLGLDLTVERDGYVGIEARSGTERGGEVYFKKRF